MTSSVSLPFATTEITPTSPLQSVIWLHGLGADSNDFLPIVPHFKTGEYTRFVFPNAPIRPVGINNGAEMRAWFDIDPNFESNQEQMDASVQGLGQLIQRELDLGFDAKDIILAGFSQGGMIAQAAALKLGIKVGQVLAMSTVLRNVERYENEPHYLVNQHTPWTIMHGQQDEVIRLDVGQSSFNELKQRGFQVDMKIYTMAHSLCPEQIKDLDKLLSRSA